MGCRARGPRSGDRQAEGRVVRVGCAVLDGDGCSPLWVAGGDELLQGLGCGSGVCGSIGFGLERDRDRGSTGSGPHRADVHLRIAGRPRRSRCHAVSRSSWRPPWFWPCSSDLRACSPCRRPCCSTIQRRSWIRSVWEASSSWCETWTASSSSPRWIRTLELFGQARTSVPRGTRSLPTCLMHCSIEGIVGASAPAEPVESPRPKPLSRAIIIMCNHGVLNGI